MPVSLKLRPGAALPLAILWMTIIAIGAAAATNRLSAERRSQANRAAEVDAFALAQTGLERYLATANAEPPAFYQTTIGGLPGGEVDITVHRLREASETTPALYVIRAHARNTGAVRFDPNTGDAVRSVARLATWVSGTMEVQSAWTSITGIHKNGASGTISGTDMCGQSPTVAGVAVPQTAVGGGPGYSQNGANPVPKGNPDILHIGANANDAAGLVNIDWEAIVTGGALAADYVLTSTSGWPNDFSDWPTIFVNNPGGNISLGPNQSGRGLLVVRGDVTLNGSFTWHGVILVGGVMGGNGAQTIHGAVVTGLNVKLGENVPRNSIGNGTKDFRYNSCYVASALSSFAGFAALSNAWVDNWPDW